MKEEAATHSAELPTDYLQLTLTSESKQNQVMLKALKEDNLLLLQQDQYEKYFRNC